MINKNLIFLTMSRGISIYGKGIYIDLLRKFRDEGYSVYVVMPHEPYTGLGTELTEQEGFYILGVRTLNLRDANPIKKGVGQILVEKQYTRAIRKFFYNVKFDLILYSTPPITFPKVVEYLKQNNPSAIAYLLLKDIFPQNAVDLGMMSKFGAKGVVYRFFRQKEKRLYAKSDYIGCMSPANVDYILKHNPQVLANKVDVAPNSIELRVENPVSVEKTEARKKYCLPLNKPIFIYGGNLGKPQGILFLIECLKANSSRADCHFVIIGNGTELPVIKKWYAQSNPSSVTVMDALPKEEYDELVSACDVGLIFLDHRFTIPNYPSRLLSYLENKMPVLCATDPNTDIGRIAQDNGYGYWCESNSVSAFTSILDKMITSDRKSMGEKGYEFLIKNYLVEHTYNAIMRHV